MNVQFTDKIIYSDDKYKIRKIWQTDAIDAIDDIHTDILKVMLEYYSDNEDIKYTFMSMDGKRLADTEFDTNIDSFYMECSQDGVFLVRKDELLAYRDKDMRLITPFKYDYASDFCNGMAAACTDNQWFCIDRNGVETPLGGYQYSCLWKYTYDYHEDMCVVISDNKQFVQHLYPAGYTRNQLAYGYVDKNGNLAIPPIYINATNFCGDIAFVAICKTENGVFVKDDLKRGVGNIYIWGGIDKRGKEVIPFIFDRITTFYKREDIFMAHYGGWENGRWGVIDKQGNWLIEPVFEDFGNWTYNSLIPFADNGQYGVYDYKQRKVILNPRYDDVYFLGNGDIKVRAYDDRLKRVTERIIDVGGNEKFYSKYTHIVEETGYLLCEIYEENTKSIEFLTYDGTVILPAVSDVWWHFKHNDEDYFTFNDKNTSLEGVKDKNGNIVIPAKYKRINRGDFPYINVETINGKDRLITIYDKEVLPAVYDSLSWCGDRYMLAVDENGCKMYQIETI